MVKMVLGTELWVIVIKTSSQESRTLLTTALQTDAFPSLYGLCWNKYFENFEQLDWFRIKFRIFIQH